MELGAQSITVDPYIPEPGCEVIGMRPDQKELEKCRASAAQYLHVVSSSCGDSRPYQAVSASGPGDMRYPKPSAEKPNIAVVSLSGVEVDMHLGKAPRFLIYGPREDGLACLLGVRDAPESGGGAERWKTVAGILGDCFVLLAAQAGNTPRQTLAEYGLPVLITDDQIEGIVDLLYGGDKKK